MIRAHRITIDNIDRLRPIYERFAQRAIADYHWAYEPVPFDAFKVSILKNVLGGYWVEDTSVEDVVGFMLYCVESHRAVEINVLYSELEDKKVLLDKVIVPFIQDIRQVDGWDVVSFAMLGEQEFFVRSLTWYGFKLVGQAIVAFDIMDSLSLQVLKQQQPPEQEAGITLEPWQPQFAGGVAETIHEAFAKSSDALWDPRFRTLNGAKEVVALIDAGMMGNHLRDYTTVALQDGVPIGFCFLVQGEGFSGNIPLIAVRPSVKRKGLSLHLLQQTLVKAIQGMLDAKVNLLKITATLDTDNIAAIKMYRRMGFRETYNYPHAYLTREKAQAFQPGKWC